MSKLITRRGLIGGLLAAPVAIQTASFTNTKLIRPKLIETGRWVYCLPDLQPSAGVWCDGYIDTEFATGLVQAEKLVIGGDIPDRARQ